MKYYLLCQDSSTDLSKSVNFYGERSILPHVITY